MGNNVSVGEAFGKFSIMLQPRHTPKAPPVQELEMQGQKQEQPDFLFCWLNLGMLAFVLFLCLSLVISTMSPRTAAGSDTPMAPELPPKEEPAGSATPLAPEVPPKEESAGSATPLAPEVPPKEEKLCFV